MSSPSFNTSTETSYGNLRATEPDSYSREIEHRIEALQPWFHNIDLRGTQTAPDHFLGDFPRFKWERIASEMPEDLRGASVLDVGCNGGFYSIEMKRRNAGHVLGIDLEDRCLEQARFAALTLGLDIE